MSFLNTCRRIVESRFSSKALYPPELPLEPKPPKPRETIDQQFIAYHTANPLVLSVIYARVCNGIREGKTYFSMRDIIGDLRDDGISINNNFTRPYTDLLIEEHPTLAPYFHRRARANGRMKRVYVS